MSHAALLLAAGKGARIRNLVADKVLAPLRGRPAIAYSAEAFRRSGSIQSLVVVYRDETQRDGLGEALSVAGWPAAAVRWIAGGKERQDSVLAGLRELPAGTDLVFIHDGARPLITAEAIQRLEEAAARTGCAALASRVTDTIKEAAPGPPAPAEGAPLVTVDRSRLWAMETPQVFRHGLILPAYEAAQAQGMRVTDDTAALEAAGYPVVLVESSSPNPKLTTSPDLAYIEYLLKRRSP